MENTKLYSENIDNLENEIAEAQNIADNAKLELLKHYLLNYILYVNMDEQESKESPVLEKLTEISILLSKLEAMNKKIKTIGTVRIVDRKMMVNKVGVVKKKSTTPFLKYKNKSEQLKKKIEVKEDKNINVKKHKSTKLN